LGFEPRNLIQFQLKGALQCQISKNIPTDAREVPTCYKESVKVLSKDRFKKWTWEKVGNAVFESFNCIIGDSIYPVESFTASVVMLFLFCSYEDSCFTYL